MQNRYWWTRMGEMQTQKKVSPKDWHFDLRILEQAYVLIAPQQTINTQLGLLQ